MINNVPTVIISGMHRSGTSAMAGALAGLGLAVGPDDVLLQPTQDNPEGYYENCAVVNCNETILQSRFLLTQRDQHDDDSLHLDEYFIDRDTLDQFGWLFGGWSPLTREPAPAESAKLSELVSQIEKRAKQGAPVIVKDPRFSLLLLPWVSRLRRPAVIIMLRHPDEVAMSMSRRDRLPLSVGYGLWLRYNKAVLAGSERLPRMVVDYSDLLENPESTLQRVGQFLADNGWVPPENAVQAATRSLRPELRRERERTGTCPADLEQYYDAVRAGNVPPDTNYDSDWQGGLAVPLLKKLEHTAGVLQHELRYTRTELQNTQRQLQHVNQRFLASQHELVRIDRHPVVGRVIRLLRRIKRDPDFGKPTLSS